MIKNLARTAPGLGPGAADSIVPRIPLGHAFGKWFVGVWFVFGGFVGLSIFSF